MGVEERKQRWQTTEARLIDGADGGDGSSSVKINVHGDVIADDYRLHVSSP